MFASKNVFKTIAEKSVKLSETTWRGTQPAWLISGDKLELILTKHGLNIASVTHIDDETKLNPFWVPKWPWSSPMENRHLHMKGESEEIYGNREDSQLLTNICGHSLCIDRFGICKLTDEPRTCHGEAAVNEWEISQCTNEYISFSVHLPLARLNIKRSFSFDNDVCYVTTWIDNASNRFVDFFQNNDESKKSNSENGDDEKKKKLNVLTMDQMKSDIASARNIGNRNEGNSNLNMNASSFMNLPSNKQQRKQTKALRDGVNSQRTYDIVRSYMEMEYQMQVIGNVGGKIKEFICSPNAFLKEYRQRNDFYAQVENDPNQNEKLNEKFQDQMVNPMDPKYSQALTFKEDDRSRYDVEWCEHITISDPFLNDAQFIMPKKVKDVNVAYNCPLKMPNSRFDGQSEISLDACLDIPKMDETDLQITEATACFVDYDQEWNGDGEEGDMKMNATNFIVKNDKLGFELEYEWNSKTFPWLCVWTEHYGTDHVPWNNKERCRGLELSTKPFPIPSLERELPKEQISKSEEDERVNLWNGQPIDFVLPNDGRAETFALRWSPIKH